MVPSSSVSEQIQYRTEEQLRSMEGAKWNRYGPEVLPAWVADMDIMPCPLAGEAVQKLLYEGDLGYPFGHNEMLAEAFSSWQLRHHGWAPDPQKVWPFTSVMHALEVLLRLHTNPGDGIVLLTPSYPPFLGMIEEMGLRLVDVDLSMKDWRLDPDRLADSLDSSSKVILFCNPHNPTGRTFDEEERRAVVELAIEHDLLIISDEIWGDLVHPEGLHQPLGLWEERFGRAFSERLIVLSSTSKTFNLAGLRCAVAYVSAPALLAGLRDLPAHYVGAPSRPGIEAALACWHRGDSWYENLMRELTARRDQVAVSLQERLPAVGFSSPQSTYLAWLDFSAYELVGDAGDWLLEKAKLALNPGRDFGNSGAGFARLNFATSPQLVEACIERMATALGD